MEVQSILVVLGTLETDWTVEHPLIRRAVSLGQHFEAELVLLHVGFEHSLGFGVFASRADIDAGRLKLLAGYRERQQRLAEEIMAVTELEVSIETLWNHDRSGCILETVRAKGGDLILKQSGEHAYVLGLLSTTDWDLLREASVPVWFVATASVHRPEDGIVTAIDQIFADDEESDEEFRLDHECFDTAKALSDRFECPLYAVHAYLVPSTLGGYEAFLPMSAVGAAIRPVVATGRAYTAEQDARAQVSRRHREVVQDFIDEHGIPLDDVIIREGPVDQVLTTTAEAMGAGLIVMGSSNKSWWDRLLGRVSAEPTLSNAGCDVLFVRPGTTPKEQT